MKKILGMLLTIGVTFIIAACSSEGSETQIDDKKETTETTVSDNSNESKEETKQGPSVEIVNSSSVSSKDSSNFVYLNSSAVFENTGDTPVEISGSMNFNKVDGGTLGGGPIETVPSVVNPGETAFLTSSILLRGVTDPSQVGETTFDFEFEETEKQSSKLETSDVKNTDGSVTGLVKNPTQELQDNIRISAALFAEDGSLVGVLSGGIRGLNPGEEASFQLNNPPLPEGSEDKITKIEVNAYSEKL